MSATSPIAFLDLEATTRQLRPELDVAWKGVLAHGQFVGGPEVTAFEDEFAQYCGTAHCIGVANGTDALELILASLGVGPGDEVVVPANTFVATAEAVRSVGALPRFVDVRPDTLLLDPAAVEAVIGPRTVAVVAVHLFGQMVDVDALADVTACHGLALVEDAAQAHGARFAGRRAGTAGVAAAFSFYPGKNLGALGDGGAVVSDDADLVARIRRLANHGRSANHRHRHEVSGRNSRLDSIQAAALSVKLPGLDAANSGRRAVAHRYRERLPEAFPLVVDHPLAESVHHLAVVRTPRRREAIELLDAAGIGWGVHYPVPCHLQPAFADAQQPALPVVEHAAETILSLPMSPSLTAEQVDRVCDVLAGATP